jgi:predicted phosphoribosyltransferase
VAGAVDRAAPVEGLTAITRKHAIADPATIHAAASDCSHSGFIDVVNVAPTANITAPENIRQNGRAWRADVARSDCFTASNIRRAVSALYSSGNQPAIDEVDSFLAEHEEARSSTPALPVIARTSSTAGDDRHP